MHQSGWDGMGWDGMGWDGMGLDGMLVHPRVTPHPQQHVADPYLYTWVKRDKVE